MGIHGIYREIGPGVRHALSKLAVQKFEESGRPLRLAIDTSIWLFQIQASKGGTNPALRTFYYRLLRLMSLSIHPLFVFDGPNRPEFKRNKRVGGGRAQVASIPEFLAKQLLKQFGFPYHLAPGEAEAECALLQRKGIVDAVLSEDVDTLMFGSGVTIKNWSPMESCKSKTPTHVDLYDATTVKSSSGLDSDGMILVAMMSGGDYITEGIPGIGPKLACEAARAGFGSELRKISRSDGSAINAWKERLQHELRSNESKYFRSKHPSITIPDDFPNLNVLAYYTSPVVSSDDKLDRLRSSLTWDQDLDLDSLRAFTADAFSWTRLSGAKHFIRNLATPLLVRALRMRGQHNDAQVPLDAIETQEAKLVHSIHGRRAHVSTDQTSEMRVAFRALDLVPIDLAMEEPDDELVVEDDADEEAVIDDPGSTQTTANQRAPTKYDPDVLEKTWVMETFVRVGAPLKVQDWEEAHRDPRKYLAMKHANKAVKKPRKTASQSGGMPKGALDRFAKISKPGLQSSKSIEVSDVEVLDALSEPALGRETFKRTAQSSSVVNKRQVAKQQQPEVITLPSSSPLRAQQEAICSADLPSTVTKRRRRSPLRRAQTSPASLFHPNRTIASSTRLAEPDFTHDPEGSKSAASPVRPLPQKKVKTTKATPTKVSNGRSNACRDSAIIPSSPPRTIDDWIQRSQSLTPRRAATTTSLADSSPARSQIQQPDSSQLEIRSVLIHEDDSSTREAIAEIDLTALDTILTKRQYPQPYSHLTPADVAKMGTSLHRADAHTRRKWDRWAPLTETSGNRQSVPCDHKKRASPPKTSVTAELPAPQLHEQHFVQIDAYMDGFWQETSASKLEKATKGPLRQEEPLGVVVWALRDVMMIDLTTMRQ